MQTDDHKETLSPVDGTLAMMPVLREKESFNLGQNEPEVYFS